MTLGQPISRYGGPRTLPWSRRQFLAFSSIGLTGCALRQTRLNPPRASLTLPVVDVRPERVIRTIVGLRPFRPPGFVVRAEKLDAKVVVHNYGHGGAEITLSWGTAQLALQEALKTGVRHCAVIGCGVVGLTTACLLRQHGFRVIIYAKALPPDTTSNIAGGLWSPVTVFDRSQVTPEFRQQFGEASRFAFRRYQSLIGDTYGVRWMPVYNLSTDPPDTQPKSQGGPYSDIEPLYPDAKQLTREENPFDVPSAYRRYSMLIQPAIYLSALMRDFRVAGGKVEVRDFAEARELLSLREDLLFNCTGLGARTLFGDNELVPVRGQLTFLLPQPEINFMTIGPGDIYMFPRQDGILLGGSHERGNWDLEPDPATTQRILSENGKLFAAMRLRSRKT